MEPMNLPVLALRGLTVFPHMSLTFDVERQISIRALERAMEGDQEIFLVTQREIGTNLPGEQDLYEVGTISHISQILRLSPNAVRVMVEGSRRARLRRLWQTEPLPGEQDLYEVGTISHISQILRLSPNAVRVMVEGSRRARLRRLWQTEPFLQANVEPLEETPVSEAAANSARTEALLRQTWNLFGEYASLAGGIPEEVVTTVMDCQDVGYLADFIAQNINLRFGDKQEILEEESPFLRLRKLNAFLVRECNVLGFEHEMEGKVRDQLVRSQRDQILRTQIRVLQNELGEEEDDELETYREKILDLQLDEERETHLMKEVSKLAKQPYSSAEAAVIRNYLDVCLEVPWNTTTRERVSVDAARKVLEKEHFGLEKVKERILETIAVRQMNRDAKGQILCLVGPPGVGKTSIAISVAKALNRKLARLSLGGVRDEADIRGHRKTYIGAMPGRIIEAITRSGSMNPLLLLDEIDKLGSDYRGDPAAALLEVLDSEQNGSFRDHYLELSVDLTGVMFITTANTTDTIPRPLLDRMEVIRLSSYTDEEKVQIARRHLLPKQLAEHGLKKSTLRISDDVLRAIIRDYTRESGVRLLERRIAAVCRKADMRLLQEEIDKLGSDYRGDPAAALLEVLDSEQNGSFRDHYLELSVDLTGVMFITTANTTDTIPRPLLDRMEVIRLSSYTDEEKVQIARRHLLPKQLAEHGLKKSTLRISDDVLRAIIRDYTRESGVRLLERRIAAVCRKADMRLLQEDVKRITVAEEELPKLLDCQPYPPALHTDREEIGVVNGLAWTEAGGEILEVEVNVMEGSGKLELTGNLGDVMKESAQAALSCLRSRAAVLGIESDFYKTKDIHVHFPEGAVPKDGPSAGIAVTTAMLSALTGRKIRAGVAMTGEVTLRGRVLAIGGLKEKSMAAYRNGIATVLIPKDNVRDLEEIDPMVRAGVRFVPVSVVDEVFAAALCLENTPVQEEVATHVAAFAPRGREGGDAAGVRFVPVSVVDEVFAAALCLENTPVQEEVATHVAAFAPRGREGGDALRQ